MIECMMTFQNRQPTEKEINTHEVHWLTLNEIWDPKKHFDDPEDEFFNHSEDEEETMALKVQQENPEDQVNEFHDCVDKMPERELFGKAVHLDIDTSRGIFVRSAELDHLLNLIPTNDLIPKEEIMAPKESNVNFFGQLPDTEMQPEVSQKLHQAQPAKIDCEKLAPHFAFMGSDIIRETMKRTTQMATATFRFPMRRHLKSMFKQLRRKRLNEVIEEQLQLLLLSAERWTSQRVLVGRAQQGRVPRAAVQGDLVQGLQGLHRLAHRQVVIPGLQRLQDVRQDVVAPPQPFHFAEGRQEQA